MKRFDSSQSSRSATRFWRDAAAVSDDGKIDDANGGDIDDDNSEDEEKLLLSLNSGTCFSVAAVVVAVCSCWVVAHHATSSNFSVRSDAGSITAPSMSRRAPDSHAYQAFLSLFKLQAACGAKADPYPPPHLTLS